LPSQLLLFLVQTHTRGSRLALPAPFYATKTESAETRHKRKHREKKKKKKKKKKGRKAKNEESYPRPPWSSKFRDQRTTHTKSPLSLSLSLDAE
jgi:hypothetical protein